MDGATLMYWVKYMCQIVLNGDYNNEYLQMMPTDVIECVWVVGKTVSMWLGY